MRSRRFRLDIKRGDTFRHSFELKQGEGSSGPAVDLTGYAVSLEVRDRYGEEGVVLEFTEANGRMTVTPTAGTIDLEMSDEDTGALTFLNTAPAKLRLVAGNGDVITVDGDAHLREV